MKSGKSRKAGEGSVRLPVLAIILFALAGCQTDALKPTDADKAAAAGQNNPPPTGDSGLYNQTLGAGSVRVGFLGVRRIDQPSRQADSEYRDGAALAVNTLGSETVKLTMLETLEKPEAIEAAVKSLSSQNMAMLITTARGSEFDAIKKALGQRQVPILAFQTNEAALPEGVYPFVSSPVDSMIEGASFAMAEGARQAVIVVSSAAEKIEAGRVARQITAFGGKVAPLIDASTGGLGVKHQASWSAADMVVLMPGLKKPGEFIKKADATKPPKPGRRLVASTVLTSADLSDPKLTGAIVCRYDQNIQARIGKRYIDSYGMPVSPQAGYGFDAMAMTIGLVNSYGDLAFSPQRMKAPEGFSGSLGVFRLEENGKVRRNCDIFKVAKGSYVFFQRAPATL
ncbi:hypothetical protein [Rhizobium sp. CECT 9324]|uniref:hypothetical protein n=1 Tax=Rhizobium sp. CECT 9324 TaxID=2845820 RepID=UPI001E327B8E|nr:hypothetical protein [Rhizobium sp. CECT 9324]CAH0342862.1 hypothetical protein RHI9324_04594 [Rhizobium sp. CECT 9324]